MNPQIPITNLNMLFFFFFFFPFFFCGGEGRIYYYLQQVRRRPGIFPKAVSPWMLFLFFFFLFNIYLFIYFGCARSQLRCADCLVAACGLLVAARGIWFADQGSNPGPLHWEHVVLPTGPPGESPECSSNLKLVSVDTGISILASNNDYMPGKQWIYTIIQSLYLTASLRVFYRLLRHDFRN